MYKLIFKLFLLLLSTKVFSYHIVFIQLGGKVPPCLFTVIKQARFLNEEANIYLLSDQAFEEEFLAKERILLVAADTISLTPEHVKFLEVNQQKGVYTSQRFFLLYDFIKERELQNVFHLENDCMLYVDLEELAAAWEQISIATPFLSKVAAVPCFVFCKDKTSLAPFIQHMLLDIAERKASDMQCLASFHKKTPMTLLPTLMEGYGKRARKSAVFVDNLTSLCFLSQNSSLFPSYIFDAAVLGVYLEGNNPEVFPLRGPGTIHYRSLFDPGLFVYFWGKDSKGRAVPYLSYQGGEYRIVNLHFHSKRPSLYTSYQENRKKL